MSKENQTSKNTTAPPICEGTKEKAFEICDILRNGILRNCEPKSFQKTAINICSEYQKYRFFGAFNYWEEVKKEIKQLDISRYPK